MFSKSTPLRIAIAFAVTCVLVAFQNCSPQSSGSSIQSSESNEGLRQDILVLSQSLSSSEPEQISIKAQERQRLLLELAEQNPAEVLRLALSETERGKMPEEVQKYLEERAQIEGRLEMYFEDYEDGRHKTRHILKLQDETRYELRFAKESFSEDFRPGRQISVKGLKLRRDSQNVIGDLVVEDPSKDILTLADGGSGSSTLAMDVSTNHSLGAQRTLVILVNFQEDPNNMPWTVNDVNSVVFGSVNDFIIENSYQQTWMTGAVAGWYTIPVSNTTCDGFAIQNYGKQAAQAAGYVLSNYDRFIFAFPKSACGYSGMAQVGAFPSSAWINNSMNLRVVGHEFIHNLGSNHAHAKDCGNVVLASSCSIQEYGDTLDIMGYSGTVGHLNTYYKERLGWLYASNVLTVGSSGNYFIEPNSLTTNGAKALKIYKGLDATTGKPIHYYLEYRQPIGFDSMIPDRGVILTSNIFYGITVREIRPTPHSWYDSYLLDMTPGSNFVDMKDAALTAGNVFNDPEAGITVTTLSVSSQGANVRVELGAGSGTPPADTTAPSVSINSPSNGASVSGIIAVAASASDNVAVSKVEFYLDGLLKLSDTSSPYSLTLDTKTLANGSHTLMAKAYDSSNNTSSAQISVNVSNSVADTILPSVAITSPANGTVLSPRTTITLQASASDNVNVSRVEFYVNGSLICSDPTASYSCAYKLGGAKGVVYLIEARAFDGAGNMAKHQISISSSGSGTGKR